MTWSLVVTANSEVVLNNNLLRSGEANYAKEIKIQRNAPNAATAYNAGMTECTGDVVVFAHQDVFLPAGWAKKLCHYMELLTSRDPHWGVAGLYGVAMAGDSAGHVYSLGLRRFVGRPFSKPIQISTLDEMLLIMQRTSGLRFDEQLPGFHLYGTDICMEAAARGMKNYVVPCFALHNSRGIKRLPLSFWRSYMYLRRKWWDRLPIATPCTRISASCSPIMEHILTTFWSSVWGKNNPGSRVDDPEQFYDEHLAAEI
jgi:GT2 family glycosyltransferase